MHEICSTYVHTDGLKAAINRCGYNYEEYNKILIESYGN